MVLTGSISAFLQNEVRWQAVLLVGFVTFFTYSIDNLIDWQKDRTHYPTIQPAAKVYHRLLWLLIPASGTAVLLLVFRSPQGIRIGMLLLGATAAMGVIRFSTYRTHTQDSVPAFIINRFFISLIWTIVCVFVPIWYGRFLGMLETSLLFLYMFFLIGIYAVVWKFEKSSSTLKKQLIQAKIFLGLEFLSVAAMTFVIVDVILRLHPPYHLVAVLGPIVYLIALPNIAASPKLFRQKISVLTGTLHLMLG